MGAGRKTLTFIVKESAPPSPTMGTNDYGNARNLKKSQLGGVIFGCNNSTIKECLFKQLFGLPGQHFSFVRNIDPGLPLFLFNYSDRKLHGIFEAASPGKLNINPYGWTKDGSERTQYPAQVQICVRMQCRPLPEDQFKPIIADNYYNQNHFWFELDHTQTSRLVSKLSSLAVAPSTSIPTNTEKWRTLFQPPASYELREGPKSFDPSAGVHEFSSIYQPNKKVGSSCNGDNKLLEGDSDKPELWEADKDLIYLQLKELAFKREHLDSISDYAEDTTNVYDLNLEGKVPETPLEPEKYQAGPAFSLQAQSVIAQLMGEIEELKAFKTEQMQKINYMEQRLVEAETEIQYLKNNCLMLESTLCPPVPPADETVLDPPDKIQLDFSEAICLIGGHDSESWLSTCDLYSPSRDVIKSLKPMNYVRSYASVTKLKGEIFVFGGGNGHMWYDTVESYNPDDNQWIMRPNLNIKKGSLAGATVNEKMFALGGGDGIKIFSDVEMFDVDLGRWIPIRSMFSKRFALAAVELNGALYASGGFDGEHYLSTVERFDPREHCWTKAGSMNTERGCHSMVVMNEKIYAMGGYDGKTMVSSVEIYDPRIGTWMMADPMNQHKGYAAATVYKEAIYVIGGIQTAANDLDIVTDLDIVERYEEGKGWQVTVSKAIGKRCFASAIVL